MKTKIFCAVSAVALSLFFPVTIRAVPLELKTDSEHSVADFLQADSTLQTFFTNSVGYAVFPGVGKGGFIVGGARGKELVYDKTNIIGQVTLTQASIGAQIGGQSFAEIIFFQTAAALEDFKSGKFEMSADISAVAAREGASKAADYKKGVAVFTLPKKGLMVQASVGGQRFDFEAEAPQPTGREGQK
jgi:lipid-binding SYLF domain-containing protein